MHYQAYTNTTRGISKARRWNHYHPLSLGFYGRLVPRTKLYVIAELVIQLWLPTLGAHAVMCDPLGGTVSCSCALLANGDLGQNARGTKRLTSTMVATRACCPQTWLTSPEAANTTRRVD